jgi:hypothetical protein
MSSRERRREAQRRRKRNTNLIIGVIVVVGISLVALLVFNSIGEGPIGESFAASGDGEHVPNGNPLPQYSTNPPTSGPHYANPLPEGFYDEDSAEARNLPNPQGFIVHSMEHGYVIFWYNCSVLPEGECEPLKEDIRSVMAGYDNYKIIAFPWSGTAEPVVATSWGYQLKMDTWDAGLAAQFIERNRNHSPEPLAR